MHIDNQPDIATSSRNSDFAAIVRLHPDSILIIDKNNEVLFANVAAARLLCRLPDCGGCIPVDWCLATDKSVTTSQIDVNGREIVLSISAQTTDWQGIPARMLTLRDITALSQQQQALEQLVYNDHLTGLYNRRGLELVAEHQQSAAKRNGHTLAAFYIDVNGLKQINDALGHSTGDAAIMETADVLRHTFRDTDIKARIGGDEFVVLVTEDTPATSKRLLDRLRHELMTRNETSDRKYRLAISIGVGRSRFGQEFNINHLLDEADRHMYVAKQIDNSEYARVHHADSYLDAAAFDDAQTIRDNTRWSETLVMYQPLG